MDETSSVENSEAPLVALTADLSQPVVLERAGQPVAVLMSIEEYEHYQTLLQDQYISASEARRVANQAVFGDLVGCALSSDEPIWSPSPKPHWRIPYRFFDGTLLKIVEVDALTRAVSLTNEERTALLAEVERLAAITDVPT